jgi:hypothetical protein
VFHRNEASYIMYNYMNNMSHASEVGSSKTKTKKCGNKSSKPFLYLVFRRSFVVVEIFSPEIKITKPNSKDD